ncbi:MAG: hypothetical protein ACRDOK_06660 [Streptosporangiaceae bacterium]
MAARYAARPCAARPSARRGAALGQRGKVHGLDLTGVVVRHEHRAAVWAGGHISRELAGGQVADQCLATRQRVRHIDDRKARGLSGSAEPVRVGHHDQAPPLGECQSDRRLADPHVRQQCVGRIGAQPVGRERQQRVARPGRYPGDGTVGRRDHPDRVAADCDCGNDRGDRIGLRLRHADDRQGAGQREQIPLLAGGMQPLAVR